MLDVNPGQSASSPLEPSATPAAGLVADPAAARPAALPDAGAETQPENVGKRSNAGTWSGTGPRSGVDRRSASGDASRHLWMDTSADDRELERMHHGTPIQCQFCVGQKFRRSRLRAADIRQLLLMRYPVRCIRCSQRQTVSFTVAGVSIPSYLRQRDGRSSTSKRPEPHSASLPAHPGPSSQTAAGPHDPAQPQQAAPGHQDLKADL